MAFNFNWSPLMADADFYSRAQEMLTTALNKSPKPPIIVDDIIVNELNLGSVPPDLEILEIGDLAEDRFRGIFKMCYSGDAFLTLKTRVQANPLNTSLSSKPSFTSPQPLAAASGLTIPLQITLSEIKLSAFIILVFSRQKGLTLVFRNDPLESLKVSSTFDSIPFVRDYLQKEIEMQLRTLMMDELPAIIHRLSLRLWCPDHSSREDQQPVQTDETETEAPIDPFASPPQDAVDSFGNSVDASEITSLTLDGGAEVHSLFSQKSLLRLAALSDSHRTLSLFTPSIRDAVFRAWAGPSERSNSDGLSSPATPKLRRSHSVGSTYSFSPRGSDDGHSNISTRPSMVSLPSAMTGLSLGAGRHRSNAGRKKRRVVDLRKPKPINETTEEGDEAGETDYSETASMAPTSILSEPILPSHSLQEPGDITPPRSPSGRLRNHNSPQKERDLSPSPRLSSTRAPNNTTGASVFERLNIDTIPLIEKDDPFTVAADAQPRRPLATPLSSRYPAEKAARTMSTFELSSVPLLYKRGLSSSHIRNESHPGILEQACMAKLANEIANKALDEKSARESFWSAESVDHRDTPPPAYEWNA